MISVPPVVKHPSDPHRCQAAARQCRQEGIRSGCFHAGKKVGEQGDHHRAIDGGQAEAEAEFPGSQNQDGNIDQKD